MLFYAFEKLSFDSLHLNSLYKIFLTDKEDQQNRKCHNYGNSHHLTDFRGSHGGVQELKPNGNRKFFGGVQIN